jgi:hypothetical protein
MKLLIMQFSPICLWRHVILLTGKTFVALHSLAEARVPILPRFYVYRAPETGLAFQVVVGWLWFVACSYLCLHHVRDTNVERNQNKWNW